VGDSRSIDLRCHRASDGTTTKENNLPKPLVALGVAGQEQHSGSLGAGEDSAS